VGRINDFVKAELSSLPKKPLETAPQATKKRYSEQVSKLVALAFARELRERGLDGTLPLPTKTKKTSGAERRMAGGIGAKKVDVSWATEESGLLFAISVKSINFRDARTKNFQKNLINRRGDALIEAVTLHRRFPYAVLACFFFLDKDAAKDNTPKRRSTFLNAHSRLRIFTGRSDPSGRDEQYERMYLLLLDAERTSAQVKTYAVGNPSHVLNLETVFDELLALVAERNPDFYECTHGTLQKVSR